ncbi:MAG: hypothetical protein HYW48_11680 [Deltaproteobacteria bacterium]|nr:hypothetical protein [Deltaproteobacteria bacterium]
MLIRIILRILVILFIAYLTVKLVRRVLGISGKNPSARLRKRMDEDVIDVCPDCGRVKDRFHRCQK